MTKSRFLAASPWKVLGAIWFLFSTVVSVLSLSSLTSSIIAWSDFLRGMIYSYQSVRDFVWSAVGTVFANIFSFIKLPIPEISHDYMTIHSMFLIALGWSFYNAKQVGNFKDLGTPWKFVFGNLFSWQIGGGYRISFVKNIEGALMNYNSLSLRKTKIDILISGKTPWVDRIQQIVVATLISVSIAICSFVTPILLRFSDYLIQSNSLAEFYRRFGVYSLSNDDVEHKDLIRENYKNFVDNYDISRHVDIYFHNLILKGLFGYICVVFALFLLVIFANHLIIQLEM